MDVDRTLGTVDLHAFIDLKRSRVRQTPVVFQHADRAAVETIHRPAKIGIFQSTYAVGLGVSADNLSSRIPEHQIRVVHSIADDGPDLWQNLGADRRRQIPARVKGN